MKNTLFICIIIQSFVILTGCVEDYDLKFGNGKGSIVIEGAITNEPGPYYVRVTKGSPSMKFPGVHPEHYSSATAITDALVILKEEGGETDTLVAAPDSIARYYPLFDSLNNVIDSVLWGYKDLPKRSANGFYMTTKIRGKPGKTYQLSVQHKGKNYEAESVMMAVPEIDSVNFKEIIIKEADGTTAMVPIIYFTDPADEKNYYLFDINTWNYGWWTQSVLDDKFLDPEKQGINIDDGFEPSWWRVNYFNGGGEFVMTISMESLTREGYDYYKGLITQFSNDGGVYSPSPSSPKSNFSNGALGFFRASSISKIIGRYGDYGTYK
jgi:hypothetical protein